MIRRFEIFYYRLQDFYYFLIDQDWKLYCMWKLLVIKEVIYQEKVSFYYM